MSVDVNIRGVRRRTITDHSSVNNSNQKLVLVGCSVVGEESSGVLVAERGSLSSDSADCSHKGEEFEMHDYDTEISRTERRSV